MSLEERQLTRSTNFKGSPVIPPILNLDDCDFSTALRRVLTPPVTDTTLDFSLPNSKSPKKSTRKNKAIRIRIKKLKPRRRPLSNVVVKPLKPIIKLSEATPNNRNEDVLSP